MRVMKDVIRMMEQQLEEMVSGQKLGMKDIEIMGEVMDIIKDAETVCAMRESTMGQSGAMGQSGGMSGYSGGGYSQGYSGNSGNSGGYSGGGYSGGNYSGNGGYSGEGASGNYSGNYSGGYSGGYSGRYSGDNRHEQMLSQLERLAGEAQNEHARKILTDAVNRLRQ